MSRDQKLKMKGIVGEFFCVTRWLTDGIVTFNEFFLCTKFWISYTIFAKFNAN